jgi:hypothetical protein
MRCQNTDLFPRALRLAENAQLSQHCGSGVVDFFPGQTIIGVEGSVRIVGVFVARRIFAAAENT